LTDRVPRRRVALTQQQTLRFAVASAIVIVALVSLQVQRGTAGDVGFVIGLPVILVLLVLWVRVYRSRGPRAN
jgi:hypothetical protein